MKIAVIIPFFQREPGILRRAIDSILAQRFEAQPVPLVDIVVVDDESPAPTADDMTGLVTPEWATIHIIRQENAGPGAARNTGLDFADDCDVVAFLDSDDEWFPDHLARAVLAFENGFEVYCCNWILANSEEDAYSGELRRGLETDKVSMMSDAGAITGDPLTVFLDTPFCMVPGLLFRKDLACDLRFPTEFRLSSEDRLFVYRLLGCSPRVLVSRTVGVRVGAGVNIFESVRWGTEERLLQLIDQVRATKIAKQLFCRRVAVRKRLGKVAGQHRAAFAANFWHLMGKNRWPMKLYRDFLRAEPSAILTLVLYPARALLGGPGKRQ